MNNLFLIKEMPKKQRCNFCNKKTGLVNFTCKCSKVFCSEHRYHDEHNCTYDHKKDRKMFIEKNNPVIVPNKVVAF